MCVFLVSTFVDGTPPESCTHFWNYIYDSVDDFRVSKLMLKGMKFAVFGLGNSLYKDSQDVDNYNVVSFSLYLILMLNHIEHLGWVLFENQEHLFYELNMPRLKENKKKIILHFFKVEIEYITSTDYFYILIVWTEFEWVFGKTFCYTFL